MIKKINAWLDSPWTLRRSFRATGIALLIEIPILIYYYAKLGIIDIQETKDWITGKFKKKSVVD